MFKPQNCLSYPFRWKIMCVQVKTLARRFADCYVTNDADRKLNCSMYTPNHLSYV